MPDNYPLSETRRLAKVILDEYRRQHPESNPLLKCCVDWDEPGAEPPPDHVSIQSLERNPLTKYKAHQQVYILNAFGLMEDPTAKTYMDYAEQEPGTVDTDGRMVICEACCKVGLGQE